MQIFSNITWHIANGDISLKFVLGRLFSQVWRSLKSDFKCCVGIEHVQTKRFLAVEPQNKRRLILQDEFHPETCAFEVHERRGSCKLVGFQNKCTRTWLGQSALGYIVCKAGNFGRNEEWEVSADFLKLK